MNEDYFTDEVKNAMENVRQSLFSILDSLEGEKTIVWDSLDLIRRINQLTGALSHQIIATHGVVEHLRLQTFVPPKAPYVLFFLSPLSTSLNDFFKFIDKCDQDAGILYEVVFIPGASYQIRERLREAQGGKYWERLEAVKEIPFWWLPTDGHCLSLNEPKLPSRLLLNHDWTILYQCAEALIEFLTLCPGKIPCYSKGQYAEMVAKMVYSEKKPFNEEILPCKRIRLNRIIIIDRWMDPLTPLLTQLTFSGLLDELYGIETNTIKVPQSEFEENKENIPSNSLKTIHLQDATFQEIRYIHREFWGAELMKITQTIEEKKKKLNFTTNTSLAEYNLLVKTKLPEIIERQKWRNDYYRLAEMMMQFDSPFSELVKMEQDLLYGATNKSNERGLLFSWVKSAESEQIPAFIEDLILEAEDLIKVLRLIAIHSLTSDGLKPPVLAIYRRLLWQSYGAEAVNKLLKMQKIGLLAEKGEELSFKSYCSPFSYTKAKNNYKILLEPGEENNKQDLAKNPHYAYNGYSPLLLQILKEGEKSHWNGWNRRGEVGNYDGDKTAVFVIGGVTRSELALIQQMPNVRLILTTAVITGKSLLENLTNI